VALLVVGAGYRMPGSVIRQLCGDMMRHREIILPGKLSTNSLLETNLPRRNSVLKVTMHIRTPYHRSHQIITVDVKLNKYIISFIISRDIRKML
jgi:hypothetical protein